MLEGKLTVKQSPEETLTILSYQVGDLQKCFHLAKRYPELAPGYNAEFRLALTLDYLDREEEHGLWVSHRWRNHTTRGRVT